MSPFCISKRRSPYLPTLINATKREKIPSPEGLSTRTHGVRLLLFVLLIYPQLKDNTLHSKIWGLNTKICGINSVSPGGDAADVAVVKANMKERMPHLRNSPLRVNVCSWQSKKWLLGVLLLWISHEQIMKFLIMHLLELGDRVEISNMKWSKIFSIISICHDMANAKTAYQIKLMFKWMCYTLYKSTTLITNREKNVWSNFIHWRSTWDAVENYRKVFN